MTPTTASTTTATNRRTDAPAATVTVYPDGPLIVRGDVAVELLGGELVSRDRAVALCRCGRSATKPLCDGSHAHARRKAGGRAACQDASDSRDDDTVGPAA